MTGRRVGVIAAAALALGLWPAIAAAADPSPALLAKGKYVLGSAGGCACHTPPDAPGAYQEQ